MSKTYEEQLGAEWDLRPVRAPVPEKSEPPIWDGASQLQIVGKPIPRIDGREKVTGKARYTTDIQLDNMLDTFVIRSPYPSAIVAGIDLSQCGENDASVVTHTIADTGATIRYEGQPIVAVAAATLERAKQAAQRAQIQVEPKPHVTSIEEALSPSAPKVYPQIKTAPGKGRLPIHGNLRGPATGGRRFKSEGDTEAAFTNSHFVHEGRFRTPVQTHSCLEPHGSVVQPLADGGFNIWTSTQSIASVVRDVARAFDIPRSLVRVHADFIGGGFGSKFGAGQHTLIAAHIARATQQPVRLILNRRAEHLCGGNRPSSDQRVRMGWEEDGTLLGLEVTSYGSAGVGTGAGVAAPFHLMYTCPARNTKEYDVFTHAGAAAAFRAPGHPQGVFALESMVDDAAFKLAMDPIDLRLKNDSHPVRRRQWERAKQLFDWDSWRQSGPRISGSIHRGIGAASSIWYNIVERGVGATVEIYTDGSVTVLSGVQDIGGGIRTVIAQVTAEALGLPLERIRVKLGDSALPLGPGSGGSKTTASLTPAVHQAAYRAQRKIAQLAAPMLGVRAEDIVIANGKVSIKGQNTHLRFEEVCARMGRERVSGHGERSDDRAGILASTSAAQQQLGSIIAGVQMAQVAVDVETGVIKVEKVCAIQDCGRVLNPLQARSQVNGGVIQGLSYALYEERRLDPISGTMTNPNLATYRIAGMADLPEILVELTNTYSGRSSTGAMGLGEPATVATAGAIGNAVFHATGTRIRTLPMSPWTVLEALEETP